MQWSGTHTSLKMDRKSEWEEHSCLSLKNQVSAKKQVTAVYLHGCDKNMEA